jgi:hypothetical protein
MQNGGCHAIDGCQGPHPFLGAKFRYLAASTFEKSTGKTLFPPYAIREFDGIPVAFIGLTLKGTPKLVAPTGVADLEFRDEADTVNALVPELKARGVEAIVVLIHEGGFPSGDYNECPGISGPIVESIHEPPCDRSLAPTNAPPAVIAVPTRIGAIGPIAATPADLMTADASAAPPKEPAAIPAAPPSVRPRPSPSPPPNVRSSQPRARLKVPPSPPPDW